MFNLTTDGGVTRVQIRVRLSSSLANDTPAINFRDVHLAGYLNKTTGAYLTRENELTQGAESTKAYVQMQIPSGTTLQWFSSKDGGLTEFIPTPQEKRDGLLRDHALGLLENLHQRLARMRADESRNLGLHASLITGYTASG